MTWHTPLNWEQTKRIHFLQMHSFSITHYIDPQYQLEERVDEFGKGYYLSLFSQTGDHVLRTQMKEAKELNGDSDSLYALYPCFGHGP